MSFYPLFQFGSKFRCFYARFEFCVSQVRSELDPDVFLLAFAEKMLHDIPWKVATELLIFVHYLFRKRQIPILCDSRKCYEVFRCYSVFLAKFF